MEGRWQDTRHLSIATLFDFVKEALCKKRSSSLQSSSMWVVITAQSIVSVLTVLADLRLKSLVTVDWEFLLLSQARDGFTDFVPWSMGCNYIFTIGSPSYNVQRMLTICFNTSPAGRYSSWLLSVPIFIDIFLSRPEP